MIHPVRRFIEVEGRRVHYRQAGSGPPAVFVHASPANSEMVLGEMAAAAPHFTCYAFDTPGFGESDPLPGERLEVADLARATAAAMGALGLPPCPVYGTHTGAAVAAELGVGFPERVSGLILEGFPVFNDSEIATIFQDYFANFVPDPLGSHFTKTWIRFRDQFTWFPWTSRHVDRLNPIDRPAPADIQHWMMMYCRCRTTYMPAYRAACFYGGKGLRAAQALCVPAVFMATEDDMLFPHLDRLPELKPDQRIARLAPDIAAKHAFIVRTLHAMQGTTATSAPSPPHLAGSNPAVQFIDTRDGQSLVRCFGDMRNPAVIVLHDAPGDGLALEALCRSLAGSRFVVLPDLPGCGESEAPPPDRNILDAAADALRAIAAALSLERFAIAGTGCGASVAAAFAAQRDRRLMALFLEDVPHKDESVAQQIAPEIPLTPEGSHWLTAWLMLRDAQIYKPWYDGRIAAQRKTQGNFDADWLHAQTFAVMKARTSYFRLPREAWRFDTAAALAAATVPVHVAPEGGLAKAVLSSPTELVQD